MYQCCLHESWVEIKKNEILGILHCVDIYDDDCIIKLILIFRWISSCYYVDIYEDCIIKLILIFRWISSCYYVDIYEDCIIKLILIFRWISSCYCFDIYEDCIIKLILIFRWISSCYYVVSFQLGSQRWSLTIIMVSTLLHFRKYQNKSFYSNSLLKYHTQSL